MGTCQDQKIKEVPGQYPLGPGGRTEALSRDLKAVPGLYWVGHFLDRVGISDGIRHAERVSEGVRKRGTQ